MDAKTELTCIVFSVSTQRGLRKASLKENDAFLNLMGEY